MFTRVSTLWCLPRRSPCWKLDILPLIESAERTGPKRSCPVDAGAGAVPEAVLLGDCSDGLTLGGVLDLSFFGAIEPGISWALGTRLGSPAVVVSSGLWLSTVLAASHPSSPAERQLC
ncbi:hypothetical protein G443_002845 [Actinoalloteichus cyanogriseus DSM 43889]|uniref:Uncharacterized protein n=1 Tax=Actinoalloteichus caeruleus DSM 43889 TaxID=1120930 RepID=A0ABT1JJ84_ACTCY|nr:hypothetical protein [Actinoalloteichus caeruleus DSM 43889]